MNPIYTYPVAKILFPLAPAAGQPLGGITAAAASPTSQDLSDVLLSLPVAFYAKLLFAGTGFSSFHLLLTPRLSQSLQGALSSLCAQALILADDQHGRHGFVWRPWLRSTREFLNRRIAVIALDSSNLEKTSSS